jgi:hypothetical protein
MSIQVPTEAVYALAHALAEQAETADEARARLAGADGLGEVQAATEQFLDCLRLGAGALAGELRLLGGAVAGAADSWLRLDAVLLAARGRAPR